MKSTPTVSAARSMASATGVRSWPEADWLTSPIALTATRLFTIGTEYRVARPSATGTRRSAEAQTLS